MRAVVPAALLALLLAGCAAPVATPVSVPLAVASASVASSVKPVLPPTPSGTAISPPPAPEAHVAVEPVEAWLEFEQGLASWYGRRFHGRRTASGERFDMHALTAAHRFLPFGTVVRVHNTLNDREVEVRINDRGPHLRGRIIDLSQAAAEALGLQGDGVQEVVLYAAPEAMVQAEAAKNSVAAVLPKPQPRRAP